MLNQQIEHAALNSWPAFQQLLYDGWLLRFADGFTKRANSITPLYPSTFEINQKIDYCEQLYYENGLPTIFRIPSFVEEIHLDESLARRNYEKRDLTRVLLLNLAGNKEDIGPEFSLTNVDLDEWLVCYAACDHSFSSSDPIFKQLLANIVTTPCFGILKLNEQMVGCGLAVVEREFVGLFKLIIHPDFRGKGYGKKLLFALLSWAEKAGASNAYLQVEDENQTARALYARLGFEEIYHYWYRILKS